MKGKIISLFMMTLLILSVLSVSGLSIINNNNEEPKTAGFNQNGYTITNLGTLGGISSYAGGMNELGDIIGRSSIPNGAHHAFLWVDGTMEDLGTPSGYLVSGATNVNDYGQVSGYTNGEYQSQYAYLWENNVWTYLGTLPGLDYSVATDINNDEQITGYSFILGPGGGHRGWIYEDGVMTDIGDLGGDDSNAFAINEQGQVVGVADTSQPGINHAFIWENGVITDLGVLPGEDESAAYDINENGVVCGASSHTLNQYPFPTFVTACVWDDSGVTEIGKLPGYTRNNAASAINNQGQVVGYSSDNGNNPHAFIWEDGVLSDLNDLIPSGSGWELKGAADINNLGQIVGYGNHNGQTRAYLLTPNNNQNEPPEFSDEDPSNGQTNVPISTTTLSVYISDPEGDSFDWSITTSPNIGSSSGTGEFDGTKNCDISGLNYETTYIWTVTATDTDGSGETTEEDYIFTTEPAPNNAPYTPSNPSPVNHALFVDINADFYWIGGDPDPGDTVTYDVYFGTSTNPPKVSSNQSATVYDPGTMNYFTKYYWRIISWDNNGASTTGPLWDFTTDTEPNNPPNTPSNPSPSDGATDVSVGTLLGWTCSDPDGDSLVYDLYLEAEDPTPDTLVSDDQTGTTYDPEGLEYSTKYYWKIIAKDSHSATTSGPIWSFTTEEATAILGCEGSLSWTNVPPGGTVQGFFSVENIGESGSLLDWEIGSYPKWGIWAFTPSSGDDLLPNNPVTVGVTIIAPNQQNKEFTGGVKIDNKEDSSDYCTIDVSLTTPRSKAFNFNFPMISWLFERFPNAFPILRHMLGL